MTLDLSPEFLFLSQFLYLTNEKHLCVTILDNGSYLVFLALMTVLFSRFIPLHVLMCESKEDPKSFVTINGKKSVPGTLIEGQPCSNLDLHTHRLR